MSHQAVRRTDGNEVLVPVWLATCRECDEVFTQTKLEPDIQTCGAHRKAYKRVKMVKKPIYVEQQEANALALKVTEPRAGAEPARKPSKSTSEGVFTDR